MAEILKLNNFDSINILETTQLSASVLSGQKIANVVNSQGIDINNFYVLGELGSELSELAKLNTKTGNALTALVNYTNSHLDGNSVTKLFGEKIKLYRALNINGSIPLDSDFSLLATIDIDVDQYSTIYTDTLGGINYWYKKTYFNSVTSEETDLSSSIAIRGGDNSYYCTIDEVRIEAGLTRNKYITDEDIYTKLVSAESEVNMSLTAGGYHLPLTTVPPVIKNATLLIAAGYLLLKNYGPESTGTNKDANLKLTEGRKLLTKIENAGGIVNGETGENLSRASRIGGYPDNTAEDEVPSESRQFHVTDVY